MEFLPYKSSDQSSILSLFRESFGKEMTKKFWEWRFLNNPLNQLLIHLAWDGDTLAAHYAVSPVLINFDNANYLTGLSMTTMTHPKYRGMKLFPQLAEQIYNKMKELDYLMVWGFPNNNSHRTFIKDLYWKDIYEIPTMRLNLSENQEGGINNISMDDGFELNYNDKPFSLYLFQVKKDKRYLRWRYAENPINRYSNIVIKDHQDVLSFCVIKKYLNSLDIVDFQARNQHDGAELLDQTVAYARNNRLEFINCWAPRHHFFHQLCEKAGFINAEPITYLCFRQLSENDGMKVSDNYTDWYIQMGDSDVY